MTEVNCIECKNKIKQENQILCRNCGGIPENIDFFKLVEEMKQNSASLNKKIIKLKQLVRSFNYDRWDERLNLLQDLSHLFGWLHWHLSFYLANTKDTNGPIAKATKKDNPKMQDADIQKIIANFDIINRRVFFVEFMFRIEHLMRRINGILAHPTPKKKYNEIVLHILRNLNISQDKDEHYRTFVFPSFVRNSLHLNGIHTDNEENGIIQGVFFKFFKDKEIIFTSWRHLYFFCNCILDELPLILESKLINKKPIILRGPKKEFWEIFQKIPPGKGIPIPKGIQLFDEEGNEI
jgi:hypothetical protein